MMSRWIVLAGTLLLAPQITQAADFCTDFGLVGKSFKIPGPGKCKPFIGFVEAAPTVWTGGACTSSDGTTAHFNVQTLDQFGIETVRFNLSLPALTDPAATDCVANGSLSCNTFSISVVACSPTTVPVP
jgi:hypothetical protein